MKDKLGLTNTLYYTQKIDRDLLESTGNSIQFFVITYMGIESKKECIYITDSLCCTAESNSTVKNDVTIKIKKKIKE